MRTPLVILLLALGSYLALGAAQASASHVSCGDTITADTTLDTDLVDCPSNGILIGAGDTRFLMWGMLFSALAVFVPITLASLAFDWGIVGVWAGLMGLILARLATCGWRFASGHWVVTGATRQAPA
jgi:hypothetical protein